MPHWWITANGAAVIARHRVVGMRLAESLGCVDELGKIPSIFGDTTQCNEVPETHRM